MNEQAKKLWKTPQGASLLGKMLDGEPLSQQDKETLEQLKQADPPKISQPSNPANKG